ncbi:HAD-IIIA family hydrolase [Candidatus Pelagibacter sp. HIMB1623]|uniref:HAD-IIIA family hydrolase n=1 Tax=Candidatus Pelagibacter sp. HIMB1623 TaxID=3413358 RepID=UPI003F85A6C7
MKVKDIVILVGGKGSRISRFTNKIPKPLIKIGSKPFLDQLILKLIKYNFNNIYLLCSYKKKIFFSKYHKKKIHNSLITCIDEGTQKGTAGALYKLRNKLKNNFILMNGDTYFDIDLNVIMKMNIINQIGVMALTYSKNLINNNKINRISLNKNETIEYTKNKSRLSNGGIYLFKKQIFEFIKNKEQSLENEVLNELINKKKIKGILFSEKIIDIGSYQNLKIIKKQYKLLKNKAFFLDRDGVLNKDNGYILNFSKFKFLSGVKKAIHYLNEKKFLVIILTNQAAVGKGLITEKKLKDIHLKMSKEINNYNEAKIDDIYYAPYYKHSRHIKYRNNSRDRKPNIGMFEKAIKKWNIDTKKSYFIGDKITDRLASKKASVRFYYKNKTSLYKQIKDIIK